MSSGLRVRSEDFWAFAAEHCTDRELDVLRMRGRGFTNREGAELLGISKKAYERRLRRAMDRMRERRQPRSGRQTT